MAKIEPAYSFFLNLAKLPRQFNFPYQLNGFSRWQLQNSSRNRECDLRWSSKFSFAFRLGSSDPTLSQTIDGGHYVNHFPHLMIKRPNIVYRTSRGNTIDAICCDYPAGLSEMLLKTLNITPDIVCFDFDMTDELIEKINHSLELAAHSRENGISDKLDLQVFDLLETVLLQHRSSKSSISPKPAEGIHAAASYFHMHLAEKADFKKLAAHFSMSRATFFRTWNEIYPLPPAKYLREIRLQEARRLLSETSLSVLEVANRSGLGNDSHFIRIFKQHFKVTPNRFRQSNGMIGENVLTSTKKNAVRKKIPHGGKSSN